MRSPAFLPVISACFFPLAEAFMVMGVAKPPSWRKEIDTLLRPETTIAEREILLKDLAAQLPEISEEVAEAARNGRFVDDVLLAEGTESKKLADDLRAVQRQMVEDILPELPTTTRKAAERLRADLPDVLRRTAEELPKFAAEQLPKIAATALDPRKVASTLAAAREEANNAFARTPDLYTPPYKVVGKGDGYEVRDYGEYAVCSTPMEGASMDDPSASGQGFNTLAGYLFGGNDRGESLSMTTPVAIDCQPDGSRTMSFVLPQGISSATAPPPRAQNTGAAAGAAAAGSVALSDVGGERLAVAEFTGFATEKEVQRQLEKLREALRRDARGPDDSGAYQVFQYNSPWTIPWRRRNEVAIRLRR